MKGRHSRRRSRAPAAILAGTLAVVALVGVIALRPAHDATPSKASRSSAVSRRGTTTSGVAPDDALKVTGDPFQARAEIGDPGCAQLLVHGGQACAVRTRQQIGLVAVTASGRHLWMTVETTATDERLATLAQGLIDSASGPTVPPGPTSR